MKNTRLAHQKGNILTAVIVSVFVLTSTVSVLGFIQGQHEATAKFFIEHSFLNIEEKVRGLLLNELAWRNTSANAANAVTLDCVIQDVPPGLCRNDGILIGDDDDDGQTDLNRQLLLFDSNATLYYSAQSPTAGFDLNGDPCNTFDAANGNDACPIRLEFDVFTKCRAGAGPCDFASLNIQGRFLHKPATRRGPAISGSRRAFTVRRDPTTQLSPDRCRELRGDFNVGANSCSMSFRNFSCRPGYAIRGFDNNEPICVPINNNDGGGR